MTPTCISSFDSPLGPLDIEHDGRSIYALTYAPLDGKPITRQPLPQAWQQLLLDYFAGEFERLNDLPVQLRTGTVFQQAVWWALRDIPAGQTVSYLELARRIGRPNAVRALGQALRRNPLAIVLPCHRVIRQGGELGGYAGQSDIGQSRKRFLLWHEGSYPAIQWWRLQPLVDEFVMPKTTSLHTLDTQSTPSHAWFEPTYHYVLKPHSTVQGFRNPWPMPKHDVNVMDWMLHRHPARWPQWQALQPQSMPPCARPDAHINDWNVWFVGHATVLIQIGPYHFLTDPVWAMRASPLSFAGPKRVRPAGLALDALPRIDGVLLSHNHYDHMDVAALKWLHARDHMPIYTGLVNRQYLPADMNVIELDWWQRVPFDLDPRLSIVFTPAQHFSGRGLKDRNKALWGGLSILTPDDHLFFAGDTGYALHFKEILQKLGAPRLALLPIGAYEPRNVMQAMHMNPSEAVQAHIDLAAQRSLAIHYRTFQLTDEAMHQPLLDLAQALTDQRLLADVFLTPLEGQAMAV